MIIYTKISIMIKILKMDLNSPVLKLKTVFPALYLTYCEKFKLN